MAGNNGEVFGEYSGACSWRSLRRSAKARGIADLMDRILSNVHAGPQEVVVQTPFMRSRSLFHFPCRLCSVVGTCSKYDEHDHRYRVFLRDPEEVAEHVHAGGPFN